MNPSASLNEAPPAAPQSLAQGIDALGRWRAGVDRKLRELSRHLGDHDLADEASLRGIDGLRQRLAADKLVLAFVAEFSRGKSELINAIFFADTGRRILPATPGRTTMCPVELGFDATEAPMLALLPIETRLEGHSLSELRQRSEAWTMVPLDPRDPAQLAVAMQQVTQVRRTGVEEARALGFWSDDRPEDNPPIDDRGQVEVPAWRHAMINYPHPLLKQGLVVLDTPGLNAIGAEAELTLGLLPSAHAAIFILGADTGVTRSDLAVWRDHLGPQSLARFVALNKIDALADPLATPQLVEAQIARQREQVAATLDLPVGRIFPLSARMALAARIEGRPEALAASRLPVFEQALAERLLPQRREVLSEAISQAMIRLHEHLHRQNADRRRQLAEQMIELRSLRGKNGAKVGLLLKRVESESAEFEQSTAKLAALRSVHARMLNEALEPLSGEALRDALEGMNESLRGSLVPLGARRAFTEMCAAVRRKLAAAQQGVFDTQGMLSSTFARLNADYGFSLAAPIAPDLAAQHVELDLIERNYEQYLGFAQTLRLSQPTHREQFRRMLVGRIRTVFESASTQIELWNNSATALVDTQLRERRRDFWRRRASLERIQEAGAELESRLSELEAQHDRLVARQTRAQGLALDVIEVARREPPARSSAGSRAHDEPAFSGSTLAPAGPSAGARASDLPKAAEPSDGEPAPLNLSLKDIGEVAPDVDIALDLEERLPRVVRAD